MTGSSRSLLMWTLLVAIVVVGLVMVVPNQDANASALSGRSNGWLAARTYLEQQGAVVTLSDRSLQKTPRPGADKGLPLWVLTFPFQRNISDEDLETLQEHLRAGGTILIGYSSTLEQRDQQQSPEERVLKSLRLGVQAVRSPPSLTPWEWWSYQREDWTLQAGEGWREAAPEVGALTLPAIQYVPEPPRQATVSVLYHHREGVVVYPVVFSYSLQRGRVVVLPAAVLSNVHLLKQGHADFLESLRLWLGSTWNFDEYHHGLVSTSASEEQGDTFAWDLFIAHVGLFYVLGLLALTRRFGTAWREGEIVAGSTSSFLRNLGALHLDLRHHQAAARILAQRKQELDPSMPEIAVPEVETDARLVEFAREIAFTSQERKS